MVGGGRRLRHAQSHHREGRDRVVPLAATAPPWWDSSRWGFPWGRARRTVCRRLPSGFGWRAAVALSATVIALPGGVELAALSRPARSPRGRRGERPRPASASVLRNRDLWLVGRLHLHLRGHADGVDGLSGALSPRRGGMALITAAPLSSCSPQLSGAAGRVVFGLLSDRLFGGRRRIVLVLAGLGSTVCTLLHRGHGQWDKSPWLPGRPSPWPRVRRHRLERRPAHLTRGARRRARRAPRWGWASPSRRFASPPARRLFGLWSSAWAAHRCPWLVARRERCCSRWCLLIPVREGRMDVHGRAVSASGRVGALLWLDHSRRRLRHHHHVHRHALHPRHLPPSRMEESMGWSHSEVQQRSGSSTGW